MLTKFLAGSKRQISFRNPLWSLSFLLGTETQLLFILPLFYVLRLYNSHIVVRAGLLAIAIKWPGHCTLDEWVRHYTPHALQWVRPMYVWHTMWNVNWQFSEGLDRFFTRKWKWLLIHLHCTTLGFRCSRQLCIVCGIWQQYLCAIL